MQSDWRRKLETSAFSIFVGCAFASAFSMPAGRVLLLCSLVCFVGHLAMSRRLPRIPAVAWLAAAFIVIAVFATVFGVNPSLGVPRLRKLVWFIGIPLAASLVISPKRLSRVLRSFALGCGVLSLKTCVTSVVRAVEAMSDGRTAEIVTLMIRGGSMTDAQRLMAGIIVSVGVLFACRKEGRRWIWWALLLALQCLAIALTFKRGSWFCTVLFVALFIGLKANWKYLLALALVIVAAFALPPVRGRLAGLRDEITQGRGGRLTMWTKVAPALIKEHPWGIGFRSLTNEMMVEVAPEVERNRDHLHSNIAQVLVATGWLGFFVWSVWMLRALVDAFTFSRLLLHGPPGYGMNAISLLLALAALMANGLVEYNFADGEIVMLYSMFMGCASTARARFHGSVRPL